MGANADAAKLERRRPRLFAFRHEGGVHVGEARLELSNFLVFSARSCGFFAPDARRACVRVDEIAFETAAETGGGSLDKAFDYNKYQVRVNLVGTAGLAKLR